METRNFTFLCRTKTNFGINALEHLPFDLSAMGVQKPLVLLDREAAGLTKPLARVFKESGMTLGLCPPMDAGLASDPKMLKELYQIYTNKGFDCIMALGTDHVADLAKILNITVSLGPDALKTANDPARITRPLKPFVYIPTGVGTGLETGTIARINGKIFDSPFLAPDLAVIDPVMLTPDTPTVLVNAGLTCLSVCCEAHVRSNNPLARAYASVGIGLVMENLLPLLKRQDPLAKPDKKTAKNLLLNLAHASTITGIVLSNCQPLVGVTLGRLVADHCMASPGQAMAMLLPVVLDFFAQETPELGDLALPLVGMDDFCVAPVRQRPGRALGKIQDLLSALYLFSSGTLPRTLEDAGIDKKALETLALFPDPPDLGAIDLKQARTILDHALDGRPVRLA